MIRGHLSPGAQIHYARLVIEPYRAGTSIKQLAARTGISATTVRRILLANQVVLRPWPSGGRAR